MITSGRLIVAAALAAAAFCARAQIVLTDDLGRRVALSQPARRVATLAPSLTEAAFAVGSGSRVVGVSAWSDHPPAAAGLPVVSTAFAIDMEALAKLSPDLVIAWKDSFRAADIPRLEALGASVFVVQSRTLTDIPRLLSVTAALAGGDAAPATRLYESRLAALRARYAGKPRVRVFLEISYRPLMTVAGRHFMGDALEACGATNVFADLAEAAPQVSWEELFARNPEAIVGTGPERGENAFRADWAERSGLEAVRRGKLAYVASRALGRPSPRVVEGIEALCIAVDKLR
ncbi:MAG: cobalamin-binding protein [Betaproteobacteria bacterium]|nr:cobalamin-binding protein [Betaproteobacteria bacterium]